MKLQILPLFIVGLASTVFAAEETTKTTNEKDNVTTRIVDGIHYAPAVRQTTPIIVKEPEKTNDDLIVMSNFTVSGSFAQKNLVQSFQEKEQSLKAEKFTNATGGYFIRNDVGAARKEVGVWPTSSSSGYDFVNLSW